MPNNSKLKMLDFRCPSIIVNFLGRMSIPSPDFPIFEEWNTDLTIKVL